MGAPFEEETPADANIPDNYVSYTLKNTKPLPPITLKNLHKNLNYLTCFLLFLIPAVGIVGACNVKLQLKTAIWAAVYYFFTGIGMFPHWPVEIDIY